MTKRMRLFKTHLEVLIRHSAFSVMCKILTIVDIDVLRGIPLPFNAKTLLRNFGLKFITICYLPKEA